MINFDFEKEFKTDYMMPLNIYAAKDYLPCGNTKSDYYKLYSESFLHAGDILFKAYYESCKNPTEEYDWNMPGVIFRAYHQAIELRLKSLLIDFENVSGHDLSKMMSKIGKYYAFSEGESYFKDFVKKFEEFSGGSQTGRYLTDNKTGNILAKTVSGEVVEINGIATLVFHIHELFGDYFNKLVKK